MDHILSELHTCLIRYTRGSVCDILQVLNPVSIIVVFFDARG